MPRFDDEQELLERLRDDAGKMKLWTEYTPDGLENTRYEIINDMVILQPRYSVKNAMIENNVGFYFHQIDKKYLLLKYFDVKINDDNIYLPIAIIEHMYHIRLGGTKTYCTEPIVVFERLANDNKHLLNAKFEHYQILETLQEYVVVDLNNPQIFIYRRDNDWQAECLAIDDDLYLKSVDYSVKVADIYDDIEFE